MIAPRGTRLLVGQGPEHGVVRYGRPSDRSLLILPGITSTALAWDFVATEIAEWCTVYAVDLRGRGRTAPVPGSTYVLEEYVQDLIAVRQALGLREPMLLGHSLGARVAAAYLQRERSPLAVLVDPPMTGPGRPAYPTSAAEFATQLAEARRPDVAVHLQRRFPHWPDRERRIRAQELRGCDPDAVALTHAAFHRETFHALWPQLDDTAVLLAGGASPVVTAHDLEELAASNPRVPIDVIPGAGHLVPWDQPTRFLSTVQNLIRKA